MAKYQDRNWQERERERGHGPEEMRNRDRSGYRAQRFENDPRSYNPEHPEQYNRETQGREFGGRRSGEYEGRYERGGFGSRGPEQGAFGSHSYEERYGEFGSGEGRGYGGQGFHEEAGFGFGEREFGDRERFGGPSRGGEHWIDVGQRQGFGGYGSQRSPIGDYGRQGRFAGRGPKNYQRPDDRVREDINERLTMHPEIDATDIVAEVKSCEVTLTGTVRDRNQKRLAEDIAESVFGVKDVRNQIRVVSREESQAQERLQKFGTEIPSAKEAQQQQKKREEELVGSGKEK